jgi:enamine deaminase RidA (YjgF/YER057c/UK114 family)
VTDGDAPEAVVPEELRAQSERWHFSPALRVGDLLLCSGQVGETPEGTFHPDAEAQFEQAFRNVATVLAAAGISWAEVVEMTTFHVDLAQHLRMFATVRDRWISSPWPAWTAVGVAALGSPDALVEVKVVARLPRNVR